MPTATFVDAPPVGPDAAGTVRRLDPGHVEAINAASASLRHSLAAVAAAWFAYLVLTPWALARAGSLAWLLVPTVGLYLFTWLGYYRHELFHRYFPGVDNPRWFRLVSYMLFSDPQVYEIAHPYHHKHVHTPRDIEFFCPDYQTDRSRRRRQFILELCFGNAAWELSCLWRLKREGLATARAGRIALVLRVALLGSTVAIAGLLAPGGAGSCLAVYAATIWLGSVMTRHDQWVEHLGITSDGTFAERNLLTRNLVPATLVDRLFLFINHDEPREHVYHHTDPGLNSRGMPGLALPADARRTTLREYASILSEHWRNL